MSSILIGFVLSFVLTTVLLLLFRHEQKRGARFGEHARAQVDFLVIKVSYHFHRLLRYIGKDMLKQVGFYAFHRFLHVLLLGIVKIEKRLRETMRVNKTLARHAERESVEMSKLEEIALHKAENALSEEEKRLHKEQALRGM